MKFAFDPQVFGFVPMPPELTAFWGEGEKWYKISAKKDSAIWYTVCRPSLMDDRWRIYSAVTSLDYVESTTSHIVFMGCITSHSFAKSLLVHVMGTCRNSDVATIGRQRVESESL